MLRPKTVGMQMVRITDHFGSSRVPLRRELLALAETAIAKQPCDFDQLMRLRLTWVEDQPTRPGLIQLEDKLTSRRMAQRANVPCPPLVASFEGDDWQHEDLAKVLSLPLQHRLCVKVTQLYAGLGVVLCDTDGRISFPAPTGPGQKMMAEWQRGAERGKINSNAYAVADFLHGMRHQRAASTEAKPLRQVPSRVMVEHAVDVHFELRVLTVLGEVVGAASDDEQAYNLQGELGDQVKAAAERMARCCRTDILRIDFFILRDGSFVLNEYCAFLWPADGFFSQQIYETAYQKMMAAYAQVFAPTWHIEQIDARIWKVTENYASFPSAGSTYQTQEVHFYCITGDSKVALVDTGTGRVSLDDVLQHCMGGIEHRSEVVVFLTHGHDDHSGGVMRAPDRWKVRMEENEARQLGLPAAVQLYDGYQEDLGGIVIEAISTPGHTAGSYSFSAGNCLFSGDCLVDGQLAFVSDRQSLYESLARLEKAAGADMQVFPSHSRTKLSASRIGAAREALEQAHQKGLWNSPDQPLTPSEVDEGYWAEFDEALSGYIIQAGPDFAFTELQASHEQFPV